MERDYFSGVASEGGTEVLGPFSLNNVNSLMAEGLVAAEPEASSVREGEVWVRARPGGEGGRGGTWRREKQSP